MNSRVLIQLMAVVVLSNSGMLNGMRMKKGKNKSKPQEPVEQRLVIPVTWNIKKACLKPEFSPKDQKTHESQCAHFGLNTKDCWVFVEVTHAYSNQYSDMYFHPDILRKKVENSLLVSKKVGTIKSLKAIYKTTILDKNPIPVLAQTYNVTEDYITNLISDCFHPAFISADLVVDKEVGDRITITADGFDLEVTIAGLPEEKEYESICLLKILSWWRSAVQRAPKAALTLLLACGIGGILLEYLKR